MMDCQSEEFISILKKFGHSMYERGILVGQGKTQSKSYRNICEQCDLEKQDFIEKYSPECLCNEPN